MGGRGYEGEGRGRIYTYRYTVTTRMTCINVGSDESRFNVSLIVRDKVTRPCPQTTTFEEKGEPKRYRTEVLPLTSLMPYHLGQTGSRLSASCQPSHTLTLCRVCPSSPPRLVTCPGGGGWGKGGGERFISHR